MNCLAAMAVENQILSWFAVVFRKACVYHTDPSAEPVSAATARPIPLQEYLPEAATTHNIITCKFKLIAGPIFTRYFFGEPVEYANSKVQMQLQLS